MIIQVGYKVKWQFIDFPHYKVTVCRKIINCKTGKIIKHTSSGGSIGFYISSKFYKRSNINEYIQIIPKEVFPF